jgi:uncharacterized protein YkwD
MLPRAKLLVTIATLLLLVTAVTASAASLTRKETRLLADVNHARVARGLRPLRLDWTLEAAARAHSADMVRSNFFAHGDFFSRVRSYGATGPVYGEDLAWGTGADGRASAIVEAWLLSPPHRENLLRPGFRRIGIGAVGGTFAGLPNAVVVTADFSGH